MSDVTAGDPDHSTHLAKLKELGAKVEELKTSEGWRSWLSTAWRFTEYSAGNCLLIWSQRPGATHIAGYRAWQKNGRQVRKGEKGIKIFAPMLLKKVDDAGEESHMLRFTVATVFDISQTSGPPLPADEHDAMWAKVDLPDDVRFEQLCESVRTNSEILVAIATAGPARGWTTFDPPVCTIVEAEPQAMVRTLLHELGHACDPELVMAEYEQHRGTDELVAEASAWLVAQRLGVGMDAPSTHYLAGWKATDAAILEAASRVIATAKTVGKILFPDPAPVAA